MTSLSSDCTQLPKMLLPLIELLFPKVLYFFHCFLLSHNLSSKWLYFISELFLKLDGAIPDVFRMWKDFQRILGSHNSLGGITWGRMRPCVSVASICSPNSVFEKQSFEFFIQPSLLIFFFYRSCFWRST